MRGFMMSTLHQILRLRWAKHVARIRAMNTANDENKPDVLKYYRVE
jgi:hypothetical protein